MPHPSLRFRKTFLHCTLAIGIAAGYSGQASAIQFQEVTQASGIRYTGESWGASWGDINGDGRPDIYANDHRLKDAIWLNNGDGTFTDATNAVDPGGVFTRENTSDTHGGTWVDYDNDGDKDLVISNGFNGRNSLVWGWRFFQNDGGLLHDVTAAKGLTYTATTGGRYPGWFDVNNDGRLDLWVLSQAGSDGELFIQDSSGGFSNTRNTYQHCNSNHFMMVSDLDMDGHMEVICVGKNAFPGRIYDTSTWPLAFRDESASVPTVQLVQDTAIADFNNDLRPDLFHVRGGKRLTGANQAADPNYVESQIIADNSVETGMRFVSPGSITVKYHWEYLDTLFSQVFLGSTGVHPSATSFTLDASNPAYWGIKPHSTSVQSDTGIYIGYDPAAQSWTFLLNPGGNVWFLSNYQVQSTAPITNIVTIGQQAADRPIKPAFYLNTPGGWVQDLKAAGLNTAISCVGVTAGDFDNDGDVDLYVVCREASANIANILYENVGNGKFVKVAAAGGAEGVIGTAQRDGAGTGDEAISADYDGDGFLDVFVTNGLNETEQRTGGPNELFHNTTNNGNHWIQLDLQGTISNRDGIGAKVIATTPNGKQQLREANGGFHRWSQDSERLHFGLADQQTVDLQVSWPSGRIDTFTAVAANHIYRVAEQGAITLNDFPPPPSPGTPITAWAGMSGGVSVLDSSLAFSGSPNAWSNSARSATLSSMGATPPYEVRWTIGSDPAASLWEVGLGITESNSSYTDVDYGLRNANGKLQMYENGTYIGAGATLRTADKLSIRVTATTLEYRLNGSLVRSRPLASGVPDFYIDSSFKSGATSLTDFTLINPSP